MVCKQAKSQERTVALLRSEVKLHCHKMSELFRRWWSGCSYSEMLPEMNKSTWIDEDAIIWEISWVKFVCIKRFIKQTVIAGKYSSPDMQSTISLHIPRWSSSSLLSVYAIKNTNPNPRDIYRSWRLWTLKLNTIKVFQYRCNLCNRESSCDSYVEYTHLRNQSSRLQKHCENSRISYHVIDCALRVSWLRYVTWSHFSQRIVRKALTDRCGRTPTRFYLRNTKASIISTCGLTSTVFDGMKRRNLCLKWTRNEVCCDCRCFTQLGRLVQPRDSIVSLGAPTQDWMNTYTI